MSNNDSQPRTFGLVAGLGVGAGIFYYRALLEAHLALGLSPRILMVHADVRRVMNHAAARQADQLAQYLAGLLGQLARGGAELASIPAFSPQICAAELAAITPLPLVSLLDAISTEVKRRRLRRVALFGARVTMETRMFGRLQDHDHNEDVEVVTARPDEAVALTANGGSPYVMLASAPNVMVWLSFATVKLWLTAVAAL